MSGDYVNKVGCRWRSSVLIGEICSGSGLLGSERVGRLTGCSERKIKKKLQEHERITRFLIEDLQTDSLDPGVL
jgi:hypothetical protein